MRARRRRRGAPRRRAAHGAHAPDPRARRPRGRAARRRPRPTAAPRASRSPAAACSTRGASRCTPRASRCPGRDGAPLGVAAPVPGELRSLWTRGGRLRRRLGGRPRRAPCSRCLPRGPRRRVGGARLGRLAAAVARLTSAACSTRGCPGAARSVRRQPTPPDPPPLVERRQWVFDLRWDRGDVWLLGVQPLDLPGAPAHARASWVASPSSSSRVPAPALVERVRFDFPLLGAPEPDAGGAPFSFTDSFARGSASSFRPLRAGRASSSSTARQGGGGRSPGPRDRRRPPGSQRGMPVCGTPHPAPLTFPMRVTYARSLAP